MGEIINLNRERKARGKAEAEAQARINRAAHGRSMADKSKTEREGELLDHTLDGAKLDKPEDET